MDTIYKIKKVEKIEIAGKSFIDVSVDFISGKDVSERRLNFSLETSSDEIKEILSKQCENIDLDLKVGEASKKLAEDNKKADGTIESLLGSELSTNKKDK